MRERRKKLAGVSGNPEAAVDDATEEETRGVTPVGVVTGKEEEPRRTATDALFEIDRPGYYIFDQDVREGRCWRCSKPFKTQMELNKFCSPKCKDGYLDEAFGKMREEK